MWFVRVHTCSFSNDEHGGKMSILCHISLQTHCFRTYFHLHRMALVLGHPRHEKWIENTGTSCVEMQLNDHFYMHTEPLANWYLTDNKWYLLNPSSNNNNSWVHSCLFGTAESNDVVGMGVSFSRNRQLSAKHDLDENHFCHGQVSPAFGHTILPLLSCIFGRKSWSC